MKRYDQIGILVYKAVRLNPTNGLLCSDLCPYLDHNMVTHPYGQTCTLQGRQKLRQSYGRPARTFTCRKAQLIRKIVKSLHVVAEYNCEGQPK